MIKLGKIICIFLRLKTPKISRNVARVGELDVEHARPILNGRALDWDETGRDGAVGGE